MPYFEFQWTEDIEEHLDEHGVSREDFMRIACNPIKTAHSRSSGLPAAWGYASDGRLLFIVHEHLDEVTLLPVTAYEVAELGDER